MYMQLLSVANREGISFIQFQLYTFVQGGRKRMCKQERKFGRTNRMKASTEVILAMLSNSKFL